MKTNAHPAREQAAQRANFWEISPLLGAAGYYRKVYAPRFDGLELVAYMQQRRSTEDRLLTRTSAAEVAPSDAGSAIPLPLTSGPHMSPRYRARRRHMYIS